MRFIGRLENVDLNTYSNKIQIRVTYTSGETTLTGTQDITTVYDTLLEKNGTSSLPQI